MAKSEVMEHWQVPTDAIWNIGQISNEQKRELEREVKRGQVRKIRSSWMGISPLKTVYIRLSEDCARTKR